jgi:hypothetical protein
MRLKRTCLFIISLTARCSCNPSEGPLYEQGVDLAADGKDEKAIRKLTPVIELNRGNERGLF